MQGNFHFPGSETIVAFITEQFFFFNVILSKKLIVHYKTHYNIGSYIFLPGKLQK